ncbi:hypothetical protein [Bacteroides caecigallinarum]|uniref:hypothetical protein n=1 Tax=Bacteroides caecigallinarum TaxID=1411144 RepID=UPI001F2CA7C2|nr:hypothetical protein [Bacteroides caecigallinarum]MCF2737770.1 hypothetical protein [Bacteroides caecigallinarum]
MKISHLVLSAILLCISTAALAQKKISYRFATKAEAQMLITDIDNFTNKLNSLDINLRLGKEDGRKSELLRLAMNETLNWSDEDKKKITAAFKSLQAKIDKQKLKIKYPHEIVLVKTSMKEEMNVTAYTRKNWIALGEDFINKATKDNLEYLLAHEMFHLLTRSDKNFKKSVYSVIGFEVTDRELFFPIDIVERKISNPDIEQYDSYAEFTIDGTKQKCSMIIYSDKAYTTGGLGDYLNVGLIPLDDNLIPLRTDGKTIIYGIDKAEDFYDKVGRNTKYTINPEEILADNFAYLLIQKKDLPNPEIIKNIAAILK